MKPRPTSLLQPLHLLGKGVVLQNTNGLQKVDTKYNIRGWLTQINDINTLGNDLFAFKINYNNPDTNYQGTALYNGNISQTHWRTSSNNILKTYGYTYDGLNRLLNAKYYAGTDPANTDRYNETLQYDKNGNITFLQRYGSYNTHKQLIDVLNYEYTGNQLINVNEASNGHLVAGFKDGNVKATTNLNDYQYDDFGNMIIDRNKGISSINYNHLNLPSYIVFNNNNQTSIHYTYNAAGQKVKKAAELGPNGVATTTTSFTDYLGGYQYNNDVLQFFPHAQGYVKHTVNPSNGASEFDYVYQYKDHLGNIRINYTFDPATSSLRILEENNYYPFGLKHQENLQARSIRFLPSTIASNEWIKGVGFFEQPPMAALVPNSGYQYKYNGKEWQDELGLNVYDYHARVYSPDAPHFWQIDPKAEEMRRWSPYSYAFNNPMRFTDPDGMSPDDIIIRGKNVATGEMQPAVVVKTDLINVTIDNENIPIIPTHDPITNKQNPASPIVITGVDNQIKKLEAAMGAADAINISLSANITAGGGITGGGEVVAFLRGKDAGGVFGYSTSSPFPAVGFSAGIGVEVGVVYSTSPNLKGFDRETMTGYSVNVSGGYGQVSGSVSMGVKGAFDWTPLYYNVSLGVPGAGMSVNGANASITNTVMQNIYVNPLKK